MNFLKRKKQTEQQVKTEVVADLSYIETDDEALKMVADNLSDKNWRDLKKMIEDGGQDITKIVSLTAQGIDKYMDYVWQDIIGTVNEYNSLSKFREQITSDKAKDIVAVKLINIRQKELYERIIKKICNM